MVSKYEAPAHCCSINVSLVSSPMNIRIHQVLPGQGKGAGANLYALLDFMVVG